MGLSRVSLFAGEHLAFFHLLFADDSLLFCQAKDRETKVVMEILKLYAEASGQCINMDKSSVFFSCNTSLQ